MIQRFKLQYRAAVPLALAISSLLPAGSLPAEDAILEIRARVGLYDQWGGNEFTNGYGQKTTTLSTTASLGVDAAFTEGGWLIGTSDRYKGANANLGVAAWVANAATGITYRIGLYDSLDGSGGSEFTLASGRQDSSLVYILPSGYVFGSSTRYSGAASSNTGSATWVADGATGITTRIGLYDQNGGNEFTRSTGAQTSQLSNTLVSANGWIFGTSSRFLGTNTALGTAAWIYDTNTGATTRIGLYDPLDAPGEFTSNTGYQYSSAAANNAATIDTGYISGITYRYGETRDNRAAWVANVQSGETVRVGLYGPEFTSSHAVNRQDSSVSFLTPTGGYALGSSLIYNGTTTNLGYAVWAANSGTGETVRLGYYDASYTRADGTANDGAQYSAIIAVNASNYAVGYSTRGGQYVGTNDAWLVDITQPSSIQSIGLEDAEFLNAAGERVGAPVSITNSGWVVGESQRYLGGTAYRGEAIYVLPTSNPSAVQRLGLWDATSATNEFTSSDGYQKRYGGVYATESGWVQGFNLRFNGQAQGALNEWGDTNDQERGVAMWVANAATGQTTRFGLTGSEFTSDGGQQTTLTANSSTLGYVYNKSVTESGYLYGLSLRYRNGDSASGRSYGYAGWLGDANNGETIRVGLWDTRHTSTTGYQSTDVSGLTEGGLAWGISTRWDGSTNTQRGQTAWIYDLTNDEQFVFELSVHSTRGDASSTIYGITDDGLAYGTYTLYEGTVNRGSRAFLWSEEDGTLLLNEELSAELATYGWSYLNNARFANEDGLFAGLATDETNVVYPTTGVYVGQVVPEPSTAVVFGLGLATLGLRRFRRA